MEVFSCLFKAKWSVSCVPNLIPYLVLHYRRGSGQNDFANGIWGQVDNFNHCIKIQVNSFCREVYKKFHLIIYSILKDLNARTIQNLLASNNNLSLLKGTAVTVFIGESSIQPASASIIMQKIRQSLRTTALQLSEMIQQENLG